MTRDRRLPIKSSRTSLTGAIFRRASRAYLITLNGLVAGLVLLFVTDRLVQTFRPKETWLEQLRHQPYYASQPWTAQLIADSARVGPDSRKYAPYVLWRRPEFSSETVNIDASGRRAVPGSECDPGAKRIFLFGSSVLWGLGAPDRLTIPALLHAELTKSLKGRLCIVNFSDVGWTSTQSLIALMLELQKNNTPDIVVFLQGMTDLFAALENNNAYLHFSYSRIAARLDAPQPIQDAWRHLFPAIWGPQEPPGSHPDPALYEQTAHVFSESMRMVEALSVRYGFRFRAFVPPDPYYANKVLTPDEAANADTQARKRELSKEAYREMLSTISKAAPRTTLMKDVFTGETGQVFIDSVHINPIGNALIARSLAKAIIPLVEPGTRSN